MRPHYSIVQSNCTEPITIDEASEHLRVDSTDDVKYISGLISVAREYAEAITGRVMYQTDFLVVCDSWHSLSSEWAGRIPIKRAPLVSVASVEYYEPDATSLTTMATTDYRVITTTDPGSIQLTESLPSVDDRPDAIQISFKAGGYADNSGMLKHAVKMFVGHLYENRLPVAFASCHEIPYTLKALLENEKTGGRF